MGGTFRSPPQIGAQDEVAVGESGAFGLRNAERGAERLLVVEPGIRDAREARFLVEPQRLPTDRVRPAAEAEPDAFPHPLSAFRSVVVQPDRHCGEGRLHLAAREDSADRVHAPILPFVRAAGKLQSRPGDGGWSFLGPKRPPSIMRAKTGIQGEMSSFVTNVRVISSLSARWETAGSPPMLFDILTYPV